MTNFIGETDCIMPDGNFLESCINISINEYISSDSYAPRMCVLEAECDDKLTNILTQNTVYLPVKTKFTKISNVGGILTYGEAILNAEFAKSSPELYLSILENLQTGKALLSDEKEIPPFLLPGCSFPLIAPPQTNIQQIEFKSISYECKPPAGSYNESCESSFSKYISTDPNLRNTELCEIELDCKDLANLHKVSSTVYFNIGDKKVSTTVQKIENCNGAIVIGNLDNQCSGLSKNHIENIGNKKGKTGKFSS